MNIEPVTVKPKKIYAEKLLTCCGLVMHWTGTIVYPSGYTYNRYGCVNCKRGRRIRIKNCKREMA